VTQADFRKMAIGFRTIKGPITMVKVAIRKLVSTLLGRKLYGMGAALAIGLRKASSTRTSRSSTSTSSPTWSSRTAAWSA
jgi:hypothetical protein